MRVLVNLLVLFQTPLDCVFAVLQQIAVDVGKDFVVEADLVIFIVIETSEEGIGKRSSEN